jgi:hypothetical protein
VVFFSLPPFFPGSAQADLVPFAAAVSTARLRIPSFPCVFLFTPTVFPASVQTDLVLFAAAVSTAAHHQLAAHLTAWMIRFDSFFLIRFTGFQNSICPKHLLCFSFHQHFPSCFFLRPPSSLGRRRPTLCFSQPRFQPPDFFPLWFSFYDPHFPRVGAGRPCALRSRGFNRQVTDPIFPLWFSSHFLHFSRVDAG